MDGWMNEWMHGCIDGWIKDGHNLHDLIFLSGVVECSSVDGNNTDGVLPVLDVNKGCDDSILVVRSLITSSRRSVKESTFSCTITNKKCTIYYIVYKTEYDLYSTSPLIIVVIEISTELKYINISIGT